MHERRLHRRHARTQLCQFIAITLGEHILARGHQLADLDERRSEIFDDLPHLDGIHPLRDVVLMQDLQNGRKPL